ncbi:6228_t:CDS:2, partial [Gigaspora rosea]
MKGHIDKLLKKAVNASKNSKATNEGSVSSESSSLNKLGKLVISEDSDLLEYSVLYMLTKEILKKSILDSITENQSSLNLPLFEGEIMLPIYKSTSSSLESKYWDLDHSKSHISSAIHFEIFFDLLFDKNDSVEAQKESFANKDQRNYKKTIKNNMAHGLVPDITITNLKHRIEFLIIEHSK